MKYLLLLLIFTCFESIAFASANDNDGNPDNFQLPQVGPKTISSYATQLKACLDNSEIGKKFLSERKSSFPNNAAELKQLFIDYKVFYSDQINSKVSQKKVAEIEAAASRNAAEFVAEEKRKVREDSERQVIAVKQEADIKVQLAQRQTQETIAEEKKRVEQQLALAKTEADMKVQLAQQKTQDTLAKMGAVLAAGDRQKFSNAQVDKIVQSLTQDDNIQIQQIRLVDGVNGAANQFVFEGTIGGENHSVTVDINDDGEYNRLKLFMALMTKMYSAKFEKAAGAFSDLFAHILESSQPQPAHFAQIDRLAGDTGKLDAWLKLQNKNATNFTAWQAMPIAGFLQIRFVPEAEIDQRRNVVLQEFDNLANVVRGVNLGSKVDGLLEKIRAFLSLPAVKNDISKQEVTDILRELGLLLKTNASGDVVIEGNYFLKLAELYESLNPSIKALANNQSLLASLDQQIRDGSALNTETLQELDVAVTALNNSSLQGTLRRVSNLNNEVVTFTNLEVPNLEHQDGGSVVKLLKSKGELKPVRVLLFMLRQFAPDAFKAVVNKTILGSLNPVAEAMCSAYFGHSLENVKKELLRHDDLDFSQDRYAVLQKAQTVNFIKKCLEQSANPNVNWDAAKATIGIATNHADKTRSLLVLRACEFLSADKEAISNVTLNSDATKAIVGNSIKQGIDNKAVVVHSAQYRLQTNKLANDADRSMFVNDYLQLSTSLDARQKLNNLGRFFTGFLAHTFKNNDLVKLVGTLPGLKDSYVKGYNLCLEGLKTFLDSASDANFTAIQVLEDKFTDDENAMVNRNIGLLKAVSKLSDKFLTTNDSTAALSTSGAAVSDSGFPVRAGLSQLEFATVLNHPEFYAAFYNASKILPLIELKIPADEELDMLKLLVSSKLQPSDKPKLNKIIVDAKKLRKAAAEFSAQIKGLFEFVNAFKVQKDIFHNPNGTESIDFYRQLMNQGAALTGQNSASGDINYQSLSIDNLLVLRGSGDTKAIDEMKRRLLTQHQQAVAPAVIFKDVFGDITQLDALPFKTDSENDITKSITSKLPPAGGDKFAVKMDNYFEPLLAAQIAYFRRVDFTTLTTGDLEKNSLQFTNQLMACIDLYLRTEVYKLSDNFNTKPDGDGNQSKFMLGLRGAQRQEITDQLKRFKAEYLNVDTVYSITKQLNTFKRFDATSTDTLNKLLRTLNPNLRKVISDAFVQVFETADFSAASVDVITPIKGAIDNYLAASAANNLNPKLSDIVILNK